MAIKRILSGKNQKISLKSDFYQFILNITMLFSGIINFFTAQYHYKDSLEKYEEARLISITCFTTSLFVLGYCPIYIYLIPYYEGVLTLSIASLFFLALPFLLRTRVKIYIIQNIFILLGYLTILSLSTFSGGIYSAITPWLVLIPIVGQLLLKKNNARFWIFVVSITFLVYCILNFQGMLVDYTGQTQIKTWWYLMSYSGLALIGMALNSVFKSIKHQSETLLQKRNEELKKVNYELDNFVYSVSHDLRGPIASILGLINLTESSVNDTSSKNNLELMRDSMNKLDQTIKEINDFARNERMEIKAEKVNFKKEINEILDELSYLIENNAININTDIQITQPFYTDAFRLSIIIKNLISNAIKFHDPEAPEPFIDIHVKVKNNICVIQISDNGIGIEKDQQDKIFNMFYRASTPSNGSGLGLYILQQTLYKINGKVCVTSALGEGSTFTVEIPDQLALNVPSNNGKLNGHNKAMTKLKKSDIEKLVMVRPPYNILTDIYDDQEGHFMANVQNEYHYKNEGGPIGAAEFGRHIAILGSMQLAKAYNFGEPYFILATEANLKRLTPNIYNTDNFYLKTRILNTEKRKGKIYGQVEDANGNSIFDGTFEYLVLNPKIFYKQYHQFYTDARVKNKVSPYRNRRSLSKINIENQHATANFGKIQIAECDGHFQNYPCIPIAIVGNLISQLCIQLFKNYMEGDFHYVVITQAKVNSYRLAFHGENLNLRANIQEKISDTRLKIYCEALVDGEIFSDAHIELEGFNTIDQRVIKYNADQVVA